MSRSLHELVQAWEEWAETADKSENGWQSDFPRWQALIAAAEDAMVNRHDVDGIIDDIELSWMISEESEEMADYAREHLDQNWDVLQALVRSPHPAVRRQVYDVLGSAGDRALPLLRDGLSDPDPYARTRARLALARVRPDEAALSGQRPATEPGPQAPDAIGERARP